MSIGYWTGEREDNAVARVPVRRCQGFCLNGVTVLCTDLNCIDER